MNALPIRDGAQYSAYSTRQKNVAYVPCRLNVNRTLENGYKNQKNSMPWHGPRPELRTERNDGMCMWAEIVAWQIVVMAESSDGRWQRVAMADG